MAHPFRVVLRQIQARLYAIVRGFRHLHGGSELIRDESKRRLSVKPALLIRLPVNGIAELSGCVGLEREPFWKVKCGEPILADGEVPFAAVYPHLLHLSEVAVIHAADAWFESQVFSVTQCQRVVFVELQLAEVDLHLATGAWRHAPLRIERLGNGVECITDARVVVGNQHLRLVRDDRSYLPGILLPHAEVAEHKREMVLRLANHIETEPSAQGVVDDVSAEPCLRAAERRLVFVVPRMLYGDV